jgi:hypothetical protein
MLAWLISLIPSVFTTINGITGAISNEKIAALNATTAQDQIAAQERVSTLEAQRDLMIADSAHSKLDLYLRTFIAIGPASYVFKIFMWDKVMGSITHGSTDALDSNLWNVVVIVLGFYFLASVTSTISRMFNK